MSRCNPSQPIKVNRVGTTRAMILGAFCSVLLSMPWLLAFAQSSLNSKETRRWVQNKAQDREVRAALKGDRAKPEADPCNPGDGTGSFDPLQCIEHQRRGWKALSDVAQRDPQASAAVRATIQKMVRELVALENQWRGLPQRERSQRLSIRTELLEAVKKEGNNVDAGLRRIINDPSKSQMTRAVAQGLLASCKQNNGDRRTADPLRSFSLCINCWCVKGEGCPCGGYDLTHF